jgi:hypothetical protein
MILLIIQIKKKLKTMKMNKNIIASSIISGAPVMSTAPGQAQSGPAVNIVNRVLIV